MKKGFAIIVICIMLLFSCSEDSPVSPAMISNTFTGQFTEQHMVGSYSWLIPLPPEYNGLNVIADVAVSQSGEPNTWTRKWYVQHGNYLIISDIHTNYYHWWYKVNVIGWKAGN